MNLIFEVLLYFKEVKCYCVAIKMSDSVQTISVNRYENKHHNISVK